jgi:hypothetical protein
MQQLHCCGDNIFNYSSACPRCANCVENGEALFVVLVAVKWQEPLGSDIEGCDSGFQYLVCRG